MKKTVLFSVMIVLGLGASAQNNLTLYNMKTIPQRFTTNPANRSDAKFFIGIPGASSLYMDVGFSAFNLGDILGAIGPDETGVETFHLRDFTEGFKKRNTVSIANQVDLLAMGLKLKRNYFYLNASLNNNFRVSFPGDLFKFLAEGNGGANLNRLFDFGFGLDALSYGELGIGYSRELIQDKLTIGARIKFIKGIGVIDTKKSDFNFTTDKETYDFLLQSDIEINSANSFQDFQGQDPLDTNGLTTDELPFSDAVDQILGRGNRGFGLDVGAVFTPIKRITVSASIVNLGRINWNTNTYNWKSNNPHATYRFEGLNVDNALTFKEEDVNRAWEELQDTLIKTFDLNENNESFTTSLFAQFYLGGNFNLTKNHNAGLLFHGTFYNKTVDPAITLSWNSKLTRILGVSVSYSIANNSFVNGGLGFSLNGGPVQYYLVSDNIIGLLAHTQTNTFNFRTGLNVTVGRKEKSKSKKKKKS